jgi:crossover junction endodeoxyribonuclease RuvC
MILWIDPWIKKLWYALIKSDLNIVDAGILELEQKKFDRVEQYRRMLEIHNFFEKIIKKNKIQKIVMEKYFITSFNLKNAEFIYGMRGVILTLALKNNIKIDEYTPIELKKRITWNWKADKKLIQKFITKYFHLKDTPEFHDTADALGLAFIWSKK